MGDRLAVCERGLCGCVFVKEVLLRYFDGIFLERVNVYGLRLPYGFSL